MRDHTSLIAWQEAEAVAIAAVQLSRRYWRPDARAIFDQLLRASVSTQVNISEGYAWTDSPTFRRHLLIAYGSSVECGDLLRLLARTGTVPASEMAEVIQRNQRAQRLILGLRHRFGRSGPPAE